MPKHTLPSLPPRAIRSIEKAVDEVFDKAKVRLLGPSAFGKRIYVGYTRALSLPGIFENAAKEEGVIPNLQTLNQILNVAGGYIDSTREKTKARVVKEVQTFLSNAHHSGVDTDLKTVLGGELQKVWSDTAYSVRRIVEAEANYTKNVGVLEGIIRVNAASGIEDPTVYFVVVRDRDLCEECKRLHMQPDGKTPRVWKLSQVGSGYHKKGEDNPKHGGLHPHCRCSIVTLMPGYGFNDGGFVTYITKGHDEYALQQGRMAKSERLQKHEAGYSITVGDGHPDVVTARDGTGREVGRLSIRDHQEPELRATAVHVEGPHRRKGLATAMYVEAEKKYGKKFVAHHQTPEGQALWAQSDRPFGR